MATKEKKKKKSGLPPGVTVTRATGPSLGPSLIDRLPLAQPVPDPTAVANSQKIEELLAMLQAGQTPDVYSAGPGFSPAQAETLNAIKRSQGEPVANWDLNAQRGGQMQAYPQGSAQDQLARRRDDYGADTTGAYQYGGSRVVDPLEEDARRPLAFRAELGDITALGQRMRAGQGADPGGFETASGSFVRTTPGSPAGRPDVAMRPQAEVSEILAAMHEDARSRGADAGPGTAPSIGGHGLYSYQQREAGRQGLTQPELLEGNRERYMENRDDLADDKARRQSLVTQRAQLGRPGFAQMQNLQALKDTLGGEGDNSILMGMLFGPGALEASMDNDSRRQGMMLTQALEQQKIRQGDRELDLKEAQYKAENSATRRKDALRGFMLDKGMPFQVIEQFLNMLPDDDAAAGQRGLVPASLGGASGGASPGLMNMPVMSDNPAERNVQLAVQLGQQTPELQTQFDTMMAPSFLKGSDYDQLPELKEHAKMAFDAKWGFLNPPSEELFEKLWQTHLQTTMGGRSASSFPWENRWGTEPQGGY